MCELVSKFCAHIRTCSWRDDECKQYFLTLTLITRTLFCTIPKKYYTIHTMSHMYMYVFTHCRSVTDYRVFTYVIDNTNHSRDISAKYSHAGGHCTAIL